MEENQKFRIKFDMKSVSSKEEKKQENTTTTTNDNG